MITIEKLKHWEIVLKLIKGKIPSDCERGIDLWPIISIATDSLGYSLVLTGYDEHNLIDRSITYMDDILADKDISFFQILGYDNFIRLIDITEGTMMKIQSERIRQYG